MWYSRILTLHQNLMFSALGNYVRYIVLTLYNFHFSSNLNILQLKWVSLNYKFMFGSLTVIFPLNNVTVVSLHKYFSTLLLHYLLYYNNDNYLALHAAYCDELHLVGMLCDDLTLKPSNFLFVTGFIKALTNFFCY